MTMYMAGPYAPGDSSAPPFPYRETFRASPFRRPDWRWVVAEHLVDGGGEPDQASHDDWIARARNYLHYGPCVLAETLGEDSDSWRAVHDATSFRANLLPRFELEARLLTGDTCERIADRFGADAATIEAYEKLFFDVRDRLGQRSYIMHQVIGPRVYAGFSVQDLDVVWKLVAYQGGTVALDAILEATWTLDRPSRLDEIAEYFAQHAEAVTARQFYLSSLSLQTQELGPRDLKNLLRILEGSDGFQASYQSLCGALPQSAGDAAPMPNIPVWASVEPEGPHSHPMAPSASIKEINASPDPSAETLERNAAASPNQPLASNTVTGITRVA